MIHHIYEYVPVYTPTLEEFSNFTKFIESIEPHVAKTYGVCKVIPPKGWRPNNLKCTPRELIENINFTIPTAITQHTTGAKGVYLQMHEEFEEPIDFEHFQTLLQPTPELDLDQYEYPTPTLEMNELERKYWKQILFNPAVYGSDIAGSFFDSNVCTSWNLQNLNTCLQRQLIKHDVCIPGVSTPFLYVGSYKSTFCWHTEDMELASINYLHCGAPKTWYGVPMAYRKRFEDLAKTLYPEEFKNCKQALRHKTMLISPTILTQNSIPVSRMTQEVGEFMITFPGAYHSGFNHGLNIAEATNFATKSWIPNGRVAQRCLCQDGTVNIDVDALFPDEQSTQVPEDDKDIDFDYYQRYRGEFLLDIDPSIRERVSVRIRLADLPEEFRTSLLAPTPAAVEETVPSSPSSPQENQDQQQNQSSEQKVKTCTAPTLTSSQEELVAVPDFQQQQELKEVKQQEAELQQQQQVEPQQQSEVSSTQETKGSPKRKRSSSTKQKQPSKKRKTTKTAAAAKNTSISSAEKRHPLFTKFYGGSRF
jgi:jumonji domain-containing protein 2